MILDQEVLSQSGGGSQPGKRGKGGGRGKEIGGGKGERGGEKKGKGYGTQKITTTTRSRTILKTEVLFSFQKP